MMATDWWAMGVSWRERQRDLSHGDVVRATAAFASEAGIAPNTVRGFKAAVEFVERLVKDGLLDEPGKHEFSRLPLKTVAVLQRVSRYGSAELEPLVRLVLGAQRPSADELIAIEARVRRRSLSESSEGLNAHAFRLGSISFRRGALAAWSAAERASGSRIAVMASNTQIEPFFVDALGMRAPAGYDGIRLLAETAGETGRPRLTEALLPALAAARAFDRFILIVQSPTDAEQLAARIRSIGDCGVGVTYYDPKRGIDRRLEPRRPRKPDLARHYSAAFAAFFPD